MAMQCPRCSFQDADNTVTVCPRCGVAMRYSLLADYKPVDEKDHFAPVKIDEPLGTNVRMKQWFKGLAVTQMIGLLLGAVALGFVVFVKQIKPGDLLEENPTLRLQLMYAVPILATIFGVMIVCWKLYMSQLIGLIVGISAAPLFLLERMLIGSQIHAMEWILLPVGTGIAGFLVGLMIAGRLKSTPVDVQYKPIDTWDRSAEARYEELDPGPQTRLNRLLLGIIGGIVFFELIMGLLKSIMNPLYKNAAMVDQLLKGANYRLPVVFTGAFVGGVLAASGTTWGKFQGMLAGFAYCCYQYYLLQPEKMEDALEIAIPCMIASILGGILGRRVLGPYKVFRGPKIKPDAAKL